MVEIGDRMLLVLRFRQVSQLFFSTSPSDLSVTSIDCHHGKSVKLIGRLQSHLLDEQA